MPNCILHIGFGKTGTSSLQSYLSDNTDITSDNRRYRYAAILPGGEVVAGVQLSALKEASSADYIVSTPELDELPSVDNFPFGGMVNDEVMPILSQEDWARRGFKFHRSNTLSHLKIRSEVIAYVRPQVEWFNSGWWQWWAWEQNFNRPRDVLESWSLNFCKWYDQLKWWKENPSVEKLTVRLQTADIIGDFLGLLGATPSVNIDAYRNNTSLTPFEAKLLKLLGKEVRRAGATQIDTLVRRILPSSGKTPWAIDKECMREIIEGCRDDNLKLMGLLDEEQREQMRADPRWWSIDPHSDKDVFDLEREDLTEEELRYVSRQLLTRLIAETSGLPLGKWSSI